MDIRHRKLAHDRWAFVAIILFVVVPGASFREASVHETTHSTRGVQQDLLQVLLPTRSGFDEILTRNIYVCGD